MRSKVAKIIITIELIVLVLAVIGVVWLFIVFRVPKEVEKVLEEEIVEEETEEVITIPKVLEKEEEIFKPEEKIVVKRKISPPPGLPQTPEEEKKFMERIENPPKPKEKGKRELEKELPKAF